MIICSGAEGTLPCNCGCTGCPDVYSTGRLARGTFEIVAAKDNYSYNIELPSKLPPRYDYRQHEKRKR